VNIIVVGGGIAGLVSSLVLKRKHKVTLVEKAPECGGLLRSWKNSSGISFDYGTHIPCETGNATVDALLFDRVRNDSWHRFKVLKTGSHFAGKLYDKSPHVDARSLPPEQYAAAARELTAPAPNGGPPPKNFAEQLTRDFGPTVTEKIQRPAMRKIFACELEELLPDNPFVLKRFVCFDEQKSRELKKIPHWDARLAFAHYNDGVPEVSSYYPKRGGVGQWSESFCAELREGGVRLATGLGVAKVEHDNGTVKGVTLDNGEKLPCGLLVWSVAPFFLLKAMDFKFASAPLKTRAMSFFHFVFDRPFLIDNHYVTCYDENFKSFRVTMYPSLQERALDGIHHCTVEAIGLGITAESAPEIRAELTRMGLVAPKAETISCDYGFIPVGFPTLTQAFLDAAHAQVSLLQENTRGVELLGRAKHDSFSIQSVSLEAYAAASKFI
jgi:protoporphyrinogen oxidase